MSEDAAVELALMVAESKSGQAGPNVAFVLAHEVRRLREEVRQYQGGNKLLELAAVRDLKDACDEFNRLREENERLKQDLADVSDTRDRAIAIAEKRTAMLARVEALPAKWREGRRRVWGDSLATHEWADELDAALKGTAEARPNLEGASTMNAHTQGEPQPSTRVATYGADIKPDHDTNALPLCSGAACPSYDGKRCKNLGFRPDRFCEPALIQLIASAEAADEPASSS